MAELMRVKNENPKLKQNQTANKLGLIFSNLQRYRNDINMLSPYRIHPNNTTKRTKQVKYTNFDNSSQYEHDLERPQMTSNDLKRPQATSKENSKNVKTKNNSKLGLFQENLENNDQYSDEILQNKNP